MLEWIQLMMAPGIRMSSPILLAAMGGLITQRAGIWNIGLESYMLVAAFTGVWVGSLTDSILLAFLGAVVAGVLAALLMGVLVVRLRADEIIVGIAMNLMGGFLTAYLLQMITQGGGFMKTNTAVPNISIGWLDKVPLVGDVLGGHDLLVYASWMSVFVVWFLIAKTQLGLQLRSAGDSPAAAAAAGVNVPSMRMIAFGLSGFFASLAGFQLAVSFLQLFSMNMIGGRGIIAFAAVIFGQANPLYTSIAALIFGFSQALANQLTTVNIPVQFVLMVPYILTIVFLVLSSLRTRKGSF